MPLLVLFQHAMVGHSCAQEPTKNWCSQLVRQLGCHTVVMGSHVGRQGLSSGSHAGRQGSSSGRHQVVTWVVMGTSHRVVMWVVNG